MNREYNIEYSIISNKTISNKYKVIKQLSHGLGSSSILLAKNIKNQEVVIKHCLTKEQYNKEKISLMLLKNFKHTPLLIDHNDNELYLVTNWCGNDLRNIDEKNKKILIPHIKNITGSLKDKHELYHNDIRWKNITMINNKLYLIDWGMANFKNTDLNHDNIFVGY